MPFKEENEPPINSLIRPESGRLSKQYLGLYSTQKMGASSEIDVITSTVTLEQLRENNNEILLLSDLTKKTQWGMHQVVQRNITESRALQIYRQFLKAEDRSIKFFPSITIVLLPIDNEIPKASYEKDQQGFNGIAGLTIKNADQSKDRPERNYFSALQWDKSQLKAIVVDGQHRVRAIRSFVSSESESVYGGDSIPVAFIILPNKTNSNVLEATRQIFIDINNLTLQKK